MLPASPRMIIPVWVQPVKSPVSKPGLTSRFPETVPATVNENVVDHGPIFPALSVASTLQYQVPDDSGEVTVYDVPVIPA